MYPPPPPFPPPIISKVCQHSYDWRSERLEHDKIDALFKHSHILEIRIDDTYQKLSISVGKDNAYGVMENAKLFLTNTRNFMIDYLRIMDRGCPKFSKKRRFLDNLKQYKSNVEKRVGACVNVYNILILFLKTSKKTIQKNDNYIFTELEYDIKQCVIELNEMRRLKDTIEHATCTNDD